MKRFHELNKEQQSTALAFAERKMEELFKDAAIESDHPLDERTKKSVIEGMAEHAWYSEREDYIIADIADGK